ncbi:MAG: VWA domain-containing protein [Pirellulales bacterium]|nr:VWA domain-containing protein [Pirellulales bacterium]
MSVEPHIPLALWVSLTLGAIVLLGSYAAIGRRRLPRGRWCGIIALMSAAVAVPLIVLLNPIRVEPVPPPAGKPLLTVLVDRSASMATSDVPSPATDTSAASARRYDEACRIASRMVDSLEDRYEVQVVSFAEQATPNSLASLEDDSPDGAATDLASAVEDVLVDRPQGQAVLVLSDGIHNAGNSLARLRQSVARAKAMAIPLLVKTIGGSSDIDDLAVSLNLPQELAFVGQRVPVVVRLKQRGATAAQTRLSLWLDNKQLDQRDVELERDATTQTVFHVAEDKTGLYRYEIRAEALPKEATVVNNTATLLLRVVDEPIRILLLEGKPYWDTKFLIRTLSMDKSIELTSLVRMAEGRLLQRTISHASQSKEDGKPKETADAARLDRWAVCQNADKQLGNANRLGTFQIIILGRDADVFLTDDVLARLKKWLVDGEGSLVCFRGPPSSQINQRLAELMPVRWTPSRESRFRVRMSEAGEALRWLSGAEGDIELASLPSLATVARPNRPKPLTVVLATAVGDNTEKPVPLISYQPVGNGRVVVIEGAGMWRWDFLPAQYKQHDQSYGILWRSLVRWLVSGTGLLPSQDFALRTDKVTFSTAETVTAVLLTSAKRSAVPPKIKLTGKTLKEPRTVTATPSGDFPGQFRVVFGRLGEGTYQASVIGSSDAAATTAFDVRGNLTERLDVAARPDILAWTAEHSGGAVLEDDDPDRLAQYFDQHLAQSRPQRNSRVGLWDRWWVLLGTFGLWGTAWGLRRTSGLV